MTRRTPQSALSASAPNEAALKLAQEIVDWSEKRLPLREGQRWITAEHITLARALLSQCAPSDVEERARAFEKRLRDGNYAEVGQSTTDPERGPSCTTLSSSAPIRQEDAVRMFCEIATALEVESTCLNLSHRMRLALGQFANDCARSASKESKK